MQKIMDKWIKDETPQGYWGWIVEDDPYSIGDVGGYGDPHKDDGRIYEDESGTWERL